MIGVLNRSRSLHPHRLQFQVRYLDVKRIGIKVSAEPCHHVLVVLMTGVSDSYGYTSLGTCLAIGIETTGESPTYIAILSSVVSLTYLDICWKHFASASRNEE